MALADNELLRSTTRGAMLRFFPRSSMVGKVGSLAGAPTLAKGTPMSFDRANAVWRPWRKAVSEINTITIVGDGGVFTVSIGGQATANLAWNVSAADMKTALEGLEAIGPGNVDVGLAALVYTITYKGRLSGVNVAPLTTGVGGLTNGLGAGTATVAVATASVDDGSNVIRGFLYPEALVTSATEEKQAVIMRTGRVHADDVPTPSGQDRSELENALKGEFPYPSLIASGLAIEGLASIR